MNTISRTVDRWGNVTVIWEDNWGDRYETIYYVEGGQSTMALD